MKYYNFSQSEILNKLEEHAWRLSTIIQALELFLYCLEGDVYANTQVELYSLGKIITEYAKNTKKNYTEIENKLGIG